MADNSIGDWIESVAQGINTMAATIGSSVAQGQSEEFIREREDVAWQRQQSMQNIINQMNQDNAATQFERVKEAALQAPQLEARGMRAAGMNLNALANGAPSAGTPAMASTGAASAPSGHGIPQRQNIAEIGQFVNSMAQSRYLAEQSKLISAQTQNVQADTANKEADTGLKGAQQYQIVSLTPAEREKLHAEREKIVNEIDKIRVDVDYVRKSMGALDAQIADCLSGAHLKDAQAWQIDQTTPMLIKKYAAEITELYSRKQLNDASAAQAYANVAYLKEQANYINGLSGLTYYQREKLIKETLNLTIDGDAKAYELAVNQTIGASEKADMIISNARSERWKNYLTPVSQLLGTAAQGYGMYRGLKASNLGKTHMTETKQTRVGWDAEGTKTVTRSWYE